MATCPGPVDLVPTACRCSTPAQGPCPRPDDPMHDDSLPRPMSSRRDDGRRRPPRRRRRDRPRSLPARPSSSPLAFALLLLAVLRSGVRADDDEKLSEGRASGRWARREGATEEGASSGAARYARDAERKPRRGRGRRRRRTTTTSCHREGKWHVSLTVPRLCTNDDDVLPSWELPAVRDNFLYDGWAECCRVMFDGTDDCGKKDACATGGADDGDEDAGADPASGGDSRCDGRRWHVSRSEEGTCTNSYDFPSLWNDDYYLGKTMFLSERECCDSLAGLGSAFCRLKEECADRLYILPFTAGSGSGSSSSSCSHPWHPTPTFDGCSNSPPGSYPHDWTVPGVSDRYLYLTHEECCAGVFDYEPGEECPKTNHCPTLAPTPSPISCPSSNAWHRGKDPNSCTNDLNYPSAWDDPRVARNYLFDSPAGCCAKYARGETCTVVDICDAMSTVIAPGEAWEPPSAPTTDAPTGSPATDPPTSAPTTDPPTGKPTPSPTADVPTGKPTSPPSPGPTAGCGGNGRKRCIKDPGCGWDESAGSCVDVVVAAAGGARVEDCGGRYHPTSVLERRCSNDDVFPSLWSEPGNVKKYFFSSGEECCATFYGDGRCVVVDICSNGD